MTPEENERLHREAAHAACQVLGIPQEEECEWYVAHHNLWRERADGLYEWCGKSCPPTPVNGSVSYTYDTQTKAWVAVKSPSN